jgi:general secretion pathway protein I
MMDRDWSVRVTRLATDDPDLIAVDVSVTAAGSDAEIVSLSGFVDRLAGGTT